MLKIGLTGGIGSGKTTVAHIFKVLGIPVLDADATARSLMENNQGLKEAIQSIFGEEVYREGRLNRTYLANIVFKDPYRLDQLNALVHPLAIDAAEQWALAQNTPYVVKEAALFFEAGSAEGLDYIIGVYAPKHIRIQRVMQRDGISREAVLDRMQRQIDDSIKMRLCDFVVVNDDQTLLIPQVLKLHTVILNASDE